MFYLFCFIIILIGSANSLNATSEPRDFSGYPSHQYDGYDSSGSYGQTMDKWVPPTVALPSISGCGGSFSSFMKPLLAAIIGVSLIKLPLLFLAKAVILKLALPFGVLLAASPIFLPLLYMMISKQNQHTFMIDTTPPPESESRALLDFLESSSCLEHIACTIGNSQARSETVKPVSWLLKWVESVMSKENSARSTVSAYRAAYLTGAYNSPKSCSVYKCVLPELVLHQGTSQFKIF